MRPLLLLLALAACAEFPVLDARIPEAERAGPPPLLPLTSLLTAAEAASPPPAFGPALAAEAARLQAQAAGLPSLGDAPDGGRLDELRARAEALRGGVLTDDEHERLGSGASLP